MMLKLAMKLSRQNLNALKLNVTVARPSLILSKRSIFALKKSFKESLPKLKQQISASAIGPLIRLAYVGLNVKMQKSSKKQTGPRKFIMVDWRPFKTTM